MKLTRITPFHIAIPYEHGAPKPIQTSGRERTTMDAVYVKVETDAGVTGWGEAYGFGACPVTLAAFVKMVGPLAEGLTLGAPGSNAVTKGDVAALMWDLRRKTQSAGLNGPVSFALSGLDIALWDIAGKTAGKPIHALLGDGNKKKVPAYASMLKLGKKEHLEKVLNIALARGHRQLKLHEKTVEAVAIARDVVGPDVQLMLDCNCAFTVDEAPRIAERLKPYNLAWFEEPIFPPDNYVALASLRKIGVPIAVGENLGNLNEVARLLDTKAVDIVQPDVCKMGGITELYKAIGLARVMNVAAEPHSPYYGPGLIASVHCLASLEEMSGHETLCEYFFADLAASPCGAAAIPQGGFLTVPNGPGLGIEVDERMLERFRASR
jgi:L-alanine-DL-glutamate epimerase-like enolase superfamily enzyme